MFCFYFVSFLSGGSKMSLYRYSNPGFLIHTSLIVSHCVNRYLVFTSLLDGVRLLSITTVVELAEFS